MSNIDSVLLGAACSRLFAECSEPERNAPDLTNRQKPLFKIRPFIRFSVYRTYPEPRSNVGKANKPGAVRKQSGKAAKKVAKPPPPSFRVRALDPVQKCGPGTSVQLLYRIEESPAGGTARTHLVFFDRHGWYCEHGRDCLAVPHAQREAKKS